MSGAPRDVRPWLVALGGYGVLALHAFADPRPPAGVWGVVGVLALSPPVKWTVLLVAALLLTPPAGRAVIRAFGRTARRLAGALGFVPAWVWIALLLAIAWSLRSRTYYGDALATVDALHAGQVINTKEPFDRLITAAVYRLGHAVTGWDAGTAIALVSTLAGATYWAGVLRLARAWPLSVGQVWPVWGLLGSCGAVALFFGHVENYSLLTAGTLWSLVLALEAVQDRGRSLVPAALATGVTVATHLSAVWLAGALPVAWWSRWRPGGGGGRGIWRPALRECGLGTLAALAPLAAAAAAVAAAGEPLAGFSLTTFGGGDGRLFVPLWSIETAYERVTMFSAAHLAAFANEVLLVAPAGAVLALLVPFGRRADGRKTDAGTWVLLAATLGTLAYAFLFNPDMAAVAPHLGALNEWDLFAFLAVPLTMAGLWWLRTAMEPGLERDALVLGVVALSVAHTLPWVLHNAGVRF
ncbi:MAG: hypothetical protein ACOY3Y_21160 [Acidobacteriota bacterium]